MRQTTKMQKLEFNQRTLTFGREKDPCMAGLQFQRRKYVALFVLNILNPNNVELELYSYFYVPLLYGECSLAQC